jgi:hypothetical protein
MRTLLLSSLLALSAFSPFAAQAEFVGPFAPIIPVACRCNADAATRTAGSAPDYACVLEVTQGVIRFAINIGFVLLTFALIYVGFVFMTSRGNPAAHGVAKQRLLNVAIGIALMLTSWLIVDFVMKTLYKEEDTRFGPWNSILADRGTNRCLQAREPDAITEGALTLREGHQAEAGGSGARGDGGTLPGTPPPSVRCTGLPDSELTSIGNGQRLHKESAQRFFRMRDAAARAGVTLTVREGYRTVATTEKYYRDRRCVNNPSRCVGVAARPCSQGGPGSNHGRGTAVDLVLGPGVLAWMRANGCDYGFCHSPTWLGDLVHWSDTGR